MQEVRKRNGAVVRFDEACIKIAIGKASIAASNALSAYQLERLAGLVVKRLSDKAFNQPIDVETIQNVVLTVLGEHHPAIATVYSEYRNDHERIRHKAALALYRPAIQEAVDYAMKSSDIYFEGDLIDFLSNGLVPNMGEKGAFVLDNIILNARQLITESEQWSYFCAAILDLKIKLEIKQVFGNSEYSLSACIGEAVELKAINPRLEHEFNHQKLEQHIQNKKLGPLLFPIILVLYDRYLKADDKGRRIETVEYFFMRVAMGLAISESDKDARAIEFYELLSNFDFMSSTPTLFNSGTNRPQLSSCFVSTVPDDLESIFGAIKDNAMMQKWAGGIGNDWTPVRGMGAIINGTNGKSQGVVPFMKVANDTLVSVNQGGKRRGSGCAYLEVWHIDIDEFLELRKNTGDERRRTHDMNTAAWVNDLFMQRVEEKGTWSLFSPNETLDLHDLYGKAFKERYELYEALGRAGQLHIYKSVQAVDLWRKMLTMLFETGHPWICFKDPCNIRNPQQHDGVVHSSNLCTEITLNTKAHPNREQNKREGEIAVCNLGSLNLVAHVNNEGVLDMRKLANTIRTAMRMLDNVIDINYHSVPQAKNANLKHRPVGLGIMGFQDVLYKKRIPYASQEAVEFADVLMEFISYHAILASSDLAVERGAYPSFEGSLWSQGILPIDSIKKLKAERGDNLELNTDARLDWDRLREKVVTQGMRNSNTMAIAPTATISSICGVSQSIEPMYQNLFIKTNLSGSFTVINRYLVDDLKALGLWDDAMINDLKYYDGSVQNIDRIPESIKVLYATAFEIPPEWLIECAARRQKWIDQSQSLNLYMKEPSGRKLDALYKLAWHRGLKTTYYLRTMGATRVRKSTSEELGACSIDDSECEACQ